MVTSKASTKATKCIAVIRITNKTNGDNVTQKKNGDNVMTTETTTTTTTTTVTLTKQMETIYTQRQQ